MATEPFVMNDLELAQQWVNACVESCGFEPDKAAKVLANLCGFGSWDVMAFAIDNMQPSKLDEHISAQDRDSRHAQYIRILVEDHAVSITGAVCIIDNLSPSSGRPKAAFEFVGDDEDSGPGSDDEMAFRPCDHEDGDSGCINCALQAVTALPCRERVAAVLPMAIHVDSDPWLSAMAYMGWTVEEVEWETDVEVMAEAPFVVYSDDGSVVPVYLSSHLPAPDFGGETSDDPSFKLFQYVCLGNFLSEWAGSEATSFVILGRWPLIYPAEDKLYFCIGVAYDSLTQSWTNLLLNRKCRDMATLLKMNREVTDLEHAAALSLPDGSLCKQLVNRLGGFCGRDFEVTYLGIPSPGRGWYVIGSIDDDDFTFALEDFLLDDFDTYPAEVTMLPR